MLKKALPLLAVILVILNILVYHDCDLYTTPIVKITGEATRQEGTISGDLEIEEPKYVQTLTGIVQNGAKKGESVTLTNVYSYSRMEDARHHKGDFIFVKKIQKNIDISNSQDDDDQKRDYFLSSLLSILLFGGVVVAGKRGFAFLLALFLNVGMLTVGLLCSEHGISFILTTAFLLVFFAGISLLCCLGRTRDTKIVLIQTLLSAAVLTVLYLLVLAITPGMDYTLQNYIRSAKINPGVYFTCGTLIGSLGAIMDVAASVTSGCSELLVRDPDISQEKLEKALRQIGLDVLGTMINVLFYTYLVGCIPILMIRIANGLSIINLIQYYFSYEILRFLAGAAGIALCVPISQKTAVYFCRKKVKVC